MFPIFFLSLSLINPSSRADCNPVNLLSSLFKGPSTEDQILAKTYAHQGPMINLFLRVKAGEVDPILLVMMLKTNGLTEDEIEKTVVDLDNLFSRYPALSSDKKVFRGETRIATSLPKVGESIIYPNYVSTTPDAKIAEFYGGTSSPGNVKAVYEITVPSKSTVLPIDQLTEKKFSGQPEFLLPRNTKFKIDALEIKDGTYYYKVHTETGN